MKRLVLAASMAAISVCANAADLKVREINKAPIAPPYVDLYSGFYIGGEIGYGFNRGTVGAFETGGIAADLGSLSAAPQGVLGGAFLGFGQRFPGLFAGLGLDTYLGVEANGDFGQLKSAGVGLAMGPGTGVVVNPKDDWLASARGRVGLIYRDVMFYFTGGWGWAGSGITATDVVAGQAVAGGSTTTGTLSGLTWGGGIEFPWFFGPNWKARAQYLQYDLGTISTCAMGTCGTPTPIMFSNKDRIDMISGALILKF